MSYFSIDQGNILAEVQDERDKLRKENKELKDKLAEVKRITLEMYEDAKKLDEYYLIYSLELMKILGMKESDYLVEVSKNE